MTSHAHKSLPLLAAILIAGLAGNAAAQPRSPGHPTPPSPTQPGTPGSPGTPGVAGRVTGAERGPLVAAGVYAFQLADSTLRKVLTDPQGNFLFQDLPIGLYKIIAHKAGFLPVVILLTRTTAQPQFLELQLPAEKALSNPKAPAAADDDFWTLRASIPPDVLRDIEQASEGELPRFADSGRGALSLGPQFHTDILAMKGVDNLTAAGEGQVEGARLGIEGRLGQMQVGLRGHFWQFGASPALGAGGAGGLGAGGAAPSATGGQASALSLDLENGPRSRVNVSSFTNRLVTRGSDGPTPVDFEHYRLSWSQAVGDNSRSEIAAQYTSESNFHRQGSSDPVDIPEASRTWRLEGSYTTELGPSSTFQGGFRYRTLQYGLPGPAGQPQTLSTTSGTPGQDSLDVFGRGGFRLQPAVLVEYGLYNTLSDGSLAMRPQGGVVLRLNDAWQLQGSASRRVYERAEVSAPQFLPTLYQEADLCEEGGRACYELRLSRQQGNDDTLALSAVDRTFGKTLRLYFSDDFFDRLESLYLVPGDRLPEVKLAVGRRLAPGVTTRFEASLASGGGGTFYAPQGRAYENRVQYLVTSLDTHFKATSTGVFLAFHRLNQGLDPLSPNAAAFSQLNLERLQLVLSQDLNILMDLVGDWTVQLNMEVSRGSSPLPPGIAGGRDDELRKRFVGGFAVKF
jgi:carboxypeptidase family protein